MTEQIFRLDGRVCVITGGSRGLGYFMAKAFLQAGAARVYITARKAEACEQAAQELSAFGECIAMPGNISSMEEIDTLVTRIKAREKAVHVLVNNAGVGWLERLEDFPEQGWDKVMDLNVKAPFFLVQKLLPLLRAGASPEATASIINIGSIAGICGATDTFSYAPSKAAVHQLTRNLAAALANDHIRVNALAPGRFFTAMTEYASANKEAYEAEIAMIPQHRWGEEADIIGPALLFASNAGAHITGQILAVDGGTTLVR